MLSIAKFNAGGGAKIEGYMRGEIDAARREDYYSAEARGQWHGGLARELGLSGEVKAGELAKILDGYSPATGEALTKNPGEDHAPGWDCTFSAPKSVSLEWAMNPAARVEIEAAQRRATEKALDYLAENAITNRDRRGEHAGQPAGDIIAATYRHGASREGDPQLHTHCAIANVVRRPDGTFAAADLDTRWKMAAGAVYRAELAAEMQKLGYSVERDGTSFRLAGADKNLEAEFSKRAAQIRAEALASGKTSHLQKMDITRDTRKAKDLSPAELRASWEAAAKEIGYTPLPRAPGEAEKGAMPLPEEMISRVIAQQSTCTEMQLHTAVMVEAQGKLTPAEAREYLRAVKASAETVELVSDKANGRGTCTTEARYTSREMYALEKGIGDRAVSMAADRTGAGAQAVSEKSIDAAMQSKSLSDEQKAALRHITAEGRCAVVQGTAGAGKSYMLDAARDAWERDGREVVGCALSGKAAEGLQESAKIKSDTIHGTLSRLEKGEIELTPRHIVVMDEAGMTGSRLMADLQKRCDVAGAKLVLVGDTRQLQPVDAGGAMREIQSKTGAAAMDEIRRQKDPDEQKMVHDFKDGRADKALEYLESKDRLKAYHSVGEARQEAAKAVVSDLGEGKTSISMADTRAACREMNESARGQMRASDMLKSADKPFIVEKNDGTKEAKSFAEGDRVIFLKNDKTLDVKNGTTGTVIKAADGKLTVKIDGDKGREVKVDQTKYQKIDHGYAYTVHKSQGVTVDRAHYAPGQMADRELGYVAGSRHREEFTLHAEKGRLAELRDDLQKSHGKGTSQDYSRKDDPRDPPEPPGKEDKDRLKDKPVSQPTKYEDAATLEGLKHEANQLWDELMTAKKNGVWGDRLVEYSDRYNAKTSEATRFERELRERNTVKPEPLVRPAAKHADIKRDGELASKALESHAKGLRCPEGKALDTAIKSGRLAEIRDSKGEMYYQDKNGNTYADRLRESRLAVKEIKDGTRVTKLVDSRIGRVSIAGKEIIKGVKIGSKVIESKGREADGARKVKKIFGTDKKDAGIIKRAADRVLTKHEKWRDAGFVRSTIARIEMGVATKNVEAKAVLELQTKAVAGKQIGRQEREHTANIRANAREVAPQRELRDPSRLREMQQLSRDLAKVANTKPPAPEVKLPEPARDKGRGMER